MNNEKILEVISIYRKRLTELRIEEKSISHVLFMSSRKEGLEHCHAMLPKMEVFLVEGRLDKVFRWLGFLQGVLWSQGLYTLNDLMCHNKKD